MNLKRLFLVLTVLILAALACSLPGQRSADETTPAADTSSQDNGSAPTGEDGGTAPTEVDSGSTDSGETGSTGDESGSSIGTQPQPGEPLDLDNPGIYNQPELFNTFKNSLDYFFEADGPVTGTVQLSSATQVEPYATTLQFLTEGNAVLGTGDVFTFTQIADIQYVVFPGVGCQSGAPGVQEDPFETALDNGGMLTGMAAFDGEEFVNGVDTYRYLLTIDNIDPLDPAGADVRSLSNGLVNVAQDGGFVVRVIVEGAGVSEVLSQDPTLEGSIYYEVNFYDFDLPVSIEIPAACVAGGDSDFPMPDDASSVSQFSGILSFNTGLSVDETQDFYEDMLPGYGCSEPTVFGDSSTGVSMQVENCDFGDAQILLTQEGSGTLVSVFTTP